MRKALTTEEFIKKAQKIHGNRYDYSKVNYINAFEKITITCKDHGDFKLSPNNHTRNSKSGNCPKCIRLKNTKSNLDYIKEAKSIHGNKYDYSQTNYKGAYSKVTIICKIHGPFETTAREHTRGTGCYECGLITIKEKLSSNLEDFILEARKIHGNKYDYSLVEYLGNKKDVTIICKKHGEFNQSPNGHLSQKQGCPICARIEVGLKNRNSREEFIKNAKKIHGNKYDYSLVEYSSNKDKVIIICKEHGQFLQRADGHITGKGCSRCKNKSEGRIAEYLEKKHIVHRSFIIKGSTRQYDFFLPDYNLIIERDGEQHYWEVDVFSHGDKDYMKKQQKNDLNKTKFAKKNGYKVARIPYWLNYEQVEREIDNILAGNPSYPDVPDLKQAETKPLPN